MSKKSKKPAIPFNVFADYSDLVMNSIFKKVADECYRQAKELTPNGVKFGPYEEVKGPPPAQTNQRCTMTPMENKMSEIKTVTHEGQVCQIGKNYLFSDNGTDFHLAKLVGIKKGKWPFQTNDADVFKYIHEASALKDIGTITPAPVKLDHGKAYTFDYFDNKHVVGVYDNKDDDFIGADDCFEPRDCTNIRLMTVESK
jgi:hypothetical protein